MVPSVRPPGLETLTERVRSGEIAPAEALRLVRGVGRTTPASGAGELHLARVGTPFSVL